MIQEIKDRVPVNVLSNDAIRYGIYDENGNLVRYEYIKREDEPAEIGTPLNKMLFNNLQGDLYTQDRYNIATNDSNEIILNLPLTSYEIGKIIKITAPATLTNPTININNLGAKQINGTIVAGDKYSFVYNGESWDIAPKDYIIGTYTGDDAESQFINLGFTPSAVLVMTKDGATKNGTGSNVGYYGGLVIEGYECKASGGYKILEIADNGFNVFYNSSKSVWANANTSSNNPFKYIAFK